MTISIEKIGDLYAAKATPPHVIAVWDSEPMTIRRLCEALVQHGAHQTDVGDALYEADPHWLEISDKEQRK